MDPFPRSGLINSTWTCRRSLFHYLWILKIIGCSFINNHFLLIVSEPSHQGFSVVVVMIPALWVKCWYFVSLHNIDSVYKDINISLKSGWSVGLDGTFVIVSALLWDITLKILAGWKSWSCEQLMWEKELSITSKRTEIVPFTMKRKTEGVL